MPPVQAPALQDRSHSMATPLMRRIAELGEASILLPILDQVRRGVIRDQRVLESLPKDTVSTCSQKPDTA